jgi:hypothetical protein
MLGDERRGTAFRELAEDEMDGCSVGPSRSVDPPSIADVVSGLVKLPRGKTAAQSLAGSLLSHAT